MGAAPIMHYDALMSQSASDLAAAIGKRIKRERVARGWTLDQFADATGVSRRAVVNVEQGIANPSVGTLLRISDALGVGLPSLVEPPEPAQVHVTRSGEGPVLWRGDAGGRGVMVASTQPPDVLVLWDWTLHPGDRHHSDAHVNGTKELLQVREGTVTLENGDRTVTLTAGDAVAFSGDLEHAYANNGDHRARFTLSVFEPSSGVARTAARPHAT